MSNASPGEPERGIYIILFRSLHKGLLWSLWALSYSVRGRKLLQFPLHIPPKAHILSHTAVRLPLNLLRHFGAKGYHIAYGDLPHALAPTHLISMLPLIMGAYARGSCLIIVPFGYSLEYSSPETESSKYSA